VELILDGDDDAAFGRAIQLGQDDPGQVESLVKEPGLGDGVLTNGGVQDQYGLVGAVLYLFADHPLDLLQLFHQVPLGMQPSGRIDDQHIYTSRLSRL